MLRMKYCLLPALIAFLAFLPVRSSYAIGRYTPADSTQELRDAARRLLPSSSLDKDLERLLRTWHKGYSTKTKRGERPCVNSDTGPYTSDSVYIRRLSALPSAVPIQFNPAVKQCIKLYTEERRRLVRYMLSLADLYFPQIEETLDRHNLPIELKYLTIVESALNPTAVSPAGAAGIWQFMLATGKIYGLTINSLVDERLDLQKSTEAACRYFKDMYDLYHDWLLCIAAYNCGLGNVNKAIRMSGGKTDFWEIYPYLPRETRNYIPLFIGAYYAMHYHIEHEICAGETGVPLATDTIMLSRQVSFDRIRLLSGVSNDELQLLNPQYKRGIIPGNTQLCRLRLPVASIKKLDKVRDSLYSPDLEASVSDFPEQGGQHSGGSGRTAIFHNVKQGETLLSIAKRYGTTVAAIKRANGLKSSSVKPGQRLQITKSSASGTKKKSTYSSKRKSRSRT